MMLLSRFEPLFDQLDILFGCRYAAFRLPLGATHAEGTSARRAKPRQRRMHPLLFKSEQYDPKYLKMNPKGVVPTLVHDGTPVIESTLICEYIDDTFPAPPLIPKDPAERARMRLWSKFVDEGLFEGVSEISFSAMFRSTLGFTPMRPNVLPLSVTISGVTVKLI